MEYVCTRTFPCVNIGSSAKTASRTPLLAPDLAVIARKGSQVVHSYREKREANKGRDRFWELSGSKIGNLTGVTEKEKVVP